METTLADHPEAVGRATAALDAGDLVVLPTDTAYAIAADALVDKAVLRAFDARGRAADRPLSVCVASYEDAHHVAYPTPLARELADRHWPGALSLVLRARPWLPDELTAGGDAIAVRCPAPAFARDLARHFGPLAMTGAHASGAPPALEASAARAALGARVALYVDGGTLPGGVVTVVDARGAEGKVLRAGQVHAL